MARRNRTLEILTTAGLVPQQLAIEQARGQRDSQMARALSSLVPSLVDSGISIYDTMSKADLAKEKLKTENALKRETLDVKREEIAAKKKTEKAGSEREKREQTKFALDLITPVIAPIVRETGTVDEAVRAVEEADRPFTVEEALGLPRPTLSPNRTLSADQRSGRQMLTEGFTELERQARDAGVTVDQLTAAGKAYNRTEDWRREDQARRDASEARDLAAKERQAEATENAARIAKGVAVEKKAEKEEARKNSLTKDEGESIKGARTVFSGLKRLRETARAAGTGGGALKAAWDKGLGLFGLSPGDSQGWATQSARMMAAYQKAVTGLGGSAAEMESIKNSWPQVTDEPEAVARKIDAIFETMRDEFEGINALRRMNGQNEIDVNIIFGGGSIAPQPQASAPSVVPKKTAAPSTTSTAPKKNRSGASESDINAMKDGW